VQQKLGELLSPVVRQEGSQIRICNCKETFVMDFSDENGGIILTQIGIIM
jgi:hypothetical protein